MTSCTKLSLKKSNVEFFLLIGGIYIKDKKMDGEILTWTNAGRDVVGSVQCVAKMEWL